MWVTREHASVPTRPSHNRKEGDVGFMMIDKGVEWRGEIYPSNHCTVSPFFYTAYKRRIDRPSLECSNAAQATKLLRANTMKEAEYIDKKDVNLGRFGVVKKGDVIQFTEHEWSGVRDDERFRHKPTEYDEPTLARAAHVLPWGAPAFDLRTIPWSYKNLFVTLEARSNKRSLLKIIEALKYIGAPLRPVHAGEQRIFLVDSIIECGELCGWLELDNQELLLLPDYDAEEHAYGVEDAHKELEPDTAMPAPINKEKPVKANVAPLRKRNRRQQTKK